METDKLTFDIIGCAMMVHHMMGPGSQEVIYQLRLAIELKRAGLVFERELEQTVYDDTIEVGTRRADFVVGGSVVVEPTSIWNKVL